MFTEAEQEGVNVEKSGTAEFMIINVVLSLREHTHVPIHSLSVSLFLLLLLVALHFPSDLYVLLSQPHFPALLLITLITCNLKF